MARTNESIAAGRNSMLSEIGMIAAWLARPTDYFHDDYIVMPPMSAADVRRLCADPQFGRPFNRRVASRLGLGDLRLMSILTRSGNVVDHGLVLKLLVCSMADILDLARKIAAIQLSPQIRTCVLKAEREQTEKILGRDAFITSLRETGVFFRHLPQRSESVSLKDTINPGRAVSVQHGAPGAKDGHTEVPPIHPLIWEGLSSISAFIRCVDEGCARLFDLRLPKRPTGGDAVADMCDAQFVEMRNLVKREQTQWQS